jgi:hypothetical protein
VAKPHRTPPEDRGQRGSRPGPAPRRHDETSPGTPDQSQAHKSVQPRPGRISPFRFVGKDGREDPDGLALTLLHDLSNHVAGRYSIWCTLHNFRMPSHLTRPPTSVTRWDGTVDHDPEMRRWIWAQITRRCLRRRVDPFDLVDDGDAKFCDSAQPPPPEHLLTLLDIRAEDLIRQKHEDIRISFSIYINLVEAEIGCMQSLDEGMTPEEMIRDALMNYQLEPAPLFRCGWAWRLGLRDLAERYARLALYQYGRGRDAYDLVYGDLVPSPLRGPVEALYAMIDRDGDEPEGG